MKEFPITSNDADQRLDKFLKKLFPNATLSFLYKLNRKGNIKIITLDTKKTKQDNEYKLQVGEKVQVFLSDRDITDLQTEKKVSTEVTQDKKLSRHDIVFEDTSLLVVNKNPGQNVHPADHKSTEISLIEQVQDYLGDGFSSLTFKPSLIHRIDRDTSGIVMIAKDKQTLTELSSDFRTPLQLPPTRREGKTIEKIYYAIVLWKLSRQSGTIRKKLKRIENAKNENKVQVSDSGQEAITHYKVFRESSVKIPDGVQYISCLEVTIETGRMHQIRVHMAALGNPILGDKTYGNKKLNGYFAKHFWVTRQMLHAWKIGFTHPKRAKKMMLEARPKKDMIEFVKKLQK